MQRDYGESEGRSVRTQTHLLSTCLVLRALGMRKNNDFLGNTVKNLAR